MLLSKRSNTAKKVSSHKFRKNNMIFNHQWSLYGSSVISSKVLKNMDRFLYIGFMFLCFTTPKRIVVDILHVQRQSVLIVPYLSAEKLTCFYIVQSRKDKFLQDLHQGSSSTLNHLEQCQITNFQFKSSDGETIFLLLLLFTYILLIFKDKGISLRKAL